MLEPLRALRARIPTFLWPALIGLLLSLGLVLPLLGALSMGSARTAVFVCLFIAAMCAVFDIGGRARWIACLGCGAFFLIYLLPGGGIPRMTGLFSAAIHLLRGNAEPLRIYGEEAAVIAGALLTFCGWAMAKQGAGFYPALSLTMVSMLVIWFSGGRDVLFLTVPALIALCALFARSIHEETPYGRILAASALAVLLALGIHPLARIVSPTLEDFAEQVRTYITDRLFFTEPRTVYSIQVDGFKPLETRLGGPVNIQEHPVMTVETSHPLLLRGVVMNFYTGLSWMDTMPSRRYLYADPRQRGARADIMDENRPPASLRDAGLFETIPISVTMQADSASTLFVPARLADLNTPMALVPYFNASGEVFITRDLKAGDTFSMTAPLVSASDPRLPALLARAAALGENRDMADYIRLHDYIAADVWSLTERVTAGAATPLEKALAIRDYLRNNYRYTLTPETPPSNQDFVSYFLLRGKEGYCTYFASAMAVMGRVAGLPTRYVEGYLVQPVDGIALVTSKKAHAWAEVYFDGFGWIAVDATPPEGLGGPRGDENRQPPEQAPDDSQGEEPPPEPSPSPEPETSDDPQSPDGSGEDQNPPPGQDAPEETPTPAPDDSQPAPSPEPAPEETPAQDHENKKKNGKWWLWLVMLLLTGAVVWRVLWVRPEAIAGRQCRNDDERLLLWYRGILGILNASELTAYPSESPIQHALRIQSAVPEESGLLAAADAVTLLGYGRYGASPAQAEEAKKCYGVLFRHAPLKAKGLWVFARTLRGMGSLRQVP
ncbi:MAG: transglutaminase-like domain-containing protein [Firmicutes bacterium]|nr:transglutaminase-like domain-containing protein [Bacillota bacterium]